MEELIPIRMLNEHLYCPRLFHLMHVQGLWDESRDTVEGRAQHSRANRRQPAAPPKQHDDPAQDHQPWPGPPRSIELGSTELGIIGKLDALEKINDDDGEAGWVPVEAKHAAPPQPQRPIMAGDIELARGAWNNDQIQLCAQAMLLEAHGYHVPFGYLYYRQTQQRVKIEFDQKLRQATLNEIVRARLTLQGPMPPPLIDSPKCPRCSLHNICLPNETNYLLQRHKKLPESVMPSRNDDRGTLYISEPGTYLGKRSQCVVISPPDDGPQTEVPLKDIAHITLAGSVQASTQLIHEALEAGCSISYLSSGGRYLGGVHPPLAKNFHIRRQQYRLIDHEEKRLTLARSIVVAKIMNQRTIVRRNGKNIQHPIGILRQFMHQARHASTINELMGIEGAAAKVYFQNFAALFTTDTASTFDWNGRSRRPPRDPINALLSLSYSLLIRDVEIALRTAGLDPQAGFYHSPQTGRSGLALDMMEAYRPLIADSVVLRLINSQALTLHDFLILPGQAALKTHARKRFFAAYEQRMAENITHPMFRYAVSYRRTLEIEARLFSRYLMDEIPDYTPLRTR